MIRLNCERSTGVDYVYIVKHGMSEPNLFSSIVQTLHTLTNLDRVGVLQNIARIELLELTYTSPVKSRLAGLLKVGGANHD